MKHKLVALHEFITKSSNIGQIWIQLFAEGKLDVSEWTGGNLGNASVIIGDGCHLKLIGNVSIDDGTRIELSKDGREKLSTYNPVLEADSLFQHNQFVFKNVTIHSLPDQETKVWDSTLQNITMEPGSQALWVKMTQARHITLAGGEDHRSFWSQLRTVLKRCEITDQNAPDYIPAGMALYSQAELLYQKTNSPQSQPDYAFMAQAFGDNVMASAGYSHLTNDAAPEVRLFNPDEFVVVAAGEYRDGADDGIGLPLSPGLLAKLNLGENPPKEFTLQPGSENLDKGIFEQIRTILVKGNENTSVLLTLGTRRYLIAPPAILSPGEHTVDFGPLIPGPR